MPDTFTEVTITTDYAPSTQANYGWSQNQLARLSGGRLWAAWAESTGRYVYAKYSDDNGATWSAAETIFDAGGTGAVIRTVALSQNGSGRLVAWVSGTAANQFRWYERATPTSTGSWSLVYTGGSGYSSNAQEMVRTCGSNVGDYFFIGVPETSGGGNSGYDQIRFFKLVPGAPWTLTAFTMNPYRPSSWTNSGGQFAAYVGGFSMVCQSNADTLHWVQRNGGRIAGTAGYTILAGTITGCANPATAAVGQAAEEVYVSGSTAAAYAGGGFSLVLDSSYRPSIGYSQQGPGTVIDRWVSTRAGGSWSALARLSSGAATVDGGYGGVGNRPGDVVEHYWGQPNLDSTTKYNLQRGTTGNTRAAITAQSSVDRFAYGAGIYEGACVWTHFATGWVLAQCPTTGASRTWTFLSSTSPSLSWNSTVQTYNKTCASGINFTQRLAPQGWVVRELTSNAVTQIPGGGRQIVRSADTIWHCYYDGEIKVAYSEDEGQTWVITSVGPTWVPAGMALCIGAGGMPVFVATRPSNDDFYIYLWNGTTWVLKKQLNEPVAQSESFQILYTGATYMLVYGYITSASDRRIYSRTSADLVTWNAQVLLKNGDGTGTGPQKYRRLAATLDGSGNVHCAYSIRSGGDHILFYRKYSSGAWGTEETVHTAGSGNNLSDYHSGLSIAIDDQGVIHLAARIKEPTYSSRIRVAYFKRSTAGVWASPEAVHSVVDADQDFPSLSLNGRRPRITWASSGLGLAVNDAFRSSDGSTWNNSQVTANTRDSVQTIHGPSYGSSYSYSRGVFGAMRGSEEYFYSSDILSGNQAFMENFLNFSSILSTQRRVMASAIAFASSLSAFNSLTFRQTIAFAQQLNFARDVRMANAFSLNQSLSGTTGLPLFHLLQFSHALAGVKDPTKVFTQAINFNSNLTLTFGRTLVSAILFAPVLAAQIYKQVSVSSGLDFGSNLALNFSLTKALTGAITWISRLLGMKEDEGCEPDFTPDRPIAGPTDNEFVYFIGPLPELSLSVQLKKPEYGNSRRQSLQVKVNRTRGGKLRVHSRTPTYEPQTMNFQDVSYLKLEQVRNFLRTSKGKKVYYIDERNRKWVGYIIGSDIDLGDESYERGGNFPIEFEGTLV